MKTLTVSSWARRVAGLWMMLVASWVVVTMALLPGCQPASRPGGGAVPMPQKSAMGAWKVVAPQAGWFQIDLADLKAAGFTGSDPGQLKLYHRGQPYTLVADGQGQDWRGRFYVQPADSLYTRDTIYWLAQNGADQAWIQASAPTSVTQVGGLPASLTPLTAPAQLDGAYFATARFEQNRQYNPQVESGDHWLWALLPAPARQTVVVTTTAVAPGPGWLRIVVWASTEAPTSPDHHLVARINGQQVANAWWDGKDRQVVDAEIPGGVLKEGPNQVEIEMPGDTGVAADIVSLDWVEVGYPRRYQAEQDRLEFTSQGGEAQLQGFSGPVNVYDITVPAQAALVEKNLPAGATFSGQAGRHYAAVGPKGYLRVEKIAPAVTSPDLRASGADYVAIGPPDLLEPLKPLLDLRQQEGLKTASLPVEAIYDQFGAGYPEPQAIQAFLSYAAKSWQPAPRYLLLVGDGSYDPRGYQAPPEANRLPVFLVWTSFGGETGSDVVFTELNGETTPSVAVGRIPARQPQQVKTVVDKIVAYEKQAAASGGEGWRRRVLAVADGQDPNFKSDAEGFLALFGSNYQTELYAPAAGTSAANQQIIDRWQQGQWLIGYFGHGSINMWGKDRLFNTDDATQLANGDRLPAVINMTCLNGLFTHPKLDSLAEALLLQPQGGAVVVLAPTSLTQPGDQSFLSRPLVQALVKDPTRRLGDCLLEARQQIPPGIENGTLSSGGRDVMETFLLFGDPALKLAY